jgi:FkbM family methyltransferase
MRCEPPKSRASPGSCTTTTRGNSPSSSPKSLESGRTYSGVEVPEGDVVLDVGANVGVAAAFFASECSAGLVHSFEPVTPIFRMLNANLRHFPACVGHNYGLSSFSRRAAITFYPNADAMSGLYADANDDGARVRTYMLNHGMSAEEAYPVR